MVTKPEGDTIASLRARLVGYLEEAGRVPRPVNRVTHWTRKLAEARRSYLSQRDALNQARGILHAGELDTVLLRETEFAFLRHKHDFASVEGPSDLIFLWSSLLAEAARKVERDEEDARAFAAVGVTRDERDIASRGIPFLPADAEDD